MKIELELKYESVKYEVLCELGKEEEKKEYIVFLKAVNESNGDPVNYIHSNLLNKFPISTAKNALLELQALLLVDTNGFLTESGREAINTGVIYDPLKGVYCFDTIINSPLKNTIISYSKEKVYGEEVIIEKQILDEVGHKIKLQDQSTIKVLAIEPSGKKSSNQSNVNLNLVYEEKKWFCYISTNKAKYNMDLSIEFYNMRLENDILNAFDIAPGSTNIILVDVDDLNNEEIITFKGSRKINYNIEKYSRMSDVLIKDLRLTPRNIVEANKWASRLFLLKYLDDYCTPTDLNAKWNYMINKNEEVFSLFTIDRPNLKNLINKINDKKKYWYLQAPLDFKLEGE